MSKLSLRGGLKAGAVALATLAFATVSLSASAQDSDVLGAAKEEGSVVFYSAAPTDVLDTLTKAFTEKYPDINAEYYRAGSSQVFQRLVAEQDAGRVNADVIHVSDPATMSDLKRQDRLSAYHSPEYDSYDPKYVDDDDTWFVARGHFLVIAYNPTVVAEGDEPKTLADFANPVFEGKVGIMDVRLAGGAYYWQYAAWKLYGPEFFDEMAANDPKLFSGHGPINDRIISGELSTGVDLNYLTDAAKEKGAPIEIVWSDEGTPMIWSPVGITKNAPHPNAAKVFIDFLASPEGQKIFNSQYSYSLRPDVDPLPGMKPLREIKILETPVDDLVAHQDEIQKALREAWGF